MAGLPHVAPPTPNGEKHPGRAVVLAIAIMGTYLIYMGNSMPPATTPSGSSDDESDMPLAQNLVSKTQMKWLISRRATWKGDLPCRNHRIPVTDQHVIDLDPLVPPH